MRFIPQQLDFERSPFTGLTRAHWVQSAEGLLEGIFSHVRDDDAPIVFPKRSAVAYPRTDALWVALRAEEAEGLARTFLIAAPLLAENPDVEAGGRRLRDYYASQVLRACDPSSPRFWGDAKNLAEANKGTPPQQMVEAAALCIGLMSCRAVIWDRYTSGHRDRVAAWLSEFAHAPTHPHNWRFFNVLIGAFLEAHGYPVDEKMILTHLAALMDYYAGDGWYRDGKQFDYYSPWAFQFYGPLWCEWIGYQKYPELAALIERRHAELMENYPHFFGRGGESLLWGRSAIYRCAASAPLVTAFRLKHTPLDPGQARRIASGNLLQFLGRQDFWQDGIPSLGFYGPRDAVLQAYSCAASPFWLAKIYQALALPAEAPFWTAQENDGAWARLGRRSSTLALDGAGLCATLHGTTGAAECRSGKVNFDNALYQRLVFNTEFPWEADDPTGLTAMAYSLRAVPGTGDFQCPIATTHDGMRDGVLYRKLVFAAGEFPPDHAEIDLAEIIIPGGVLRVDRVRIAGAYELSLGHFGLPHESDRAPATVKFANGLSAMGKTRGLFLAGLGGWNEFGAHVHSGKNVETEISTVLYARKRVSSARPSGELVVTLMLHRTDAVGWSEVEANPIERWTEIEHTPSGAPQIIVVVFKNGETRTVDFGGQEGAAKSETPSPA
ncbi:DUF2264 domain-containing protein [Oleiharenicola lentus]|uniref:DUF2264 domain-containing protein n=1 Tax=Oleiharenicola lentus TaxID=2508720 RepID=UPI003F67CEA1